MVMKGIMFLSDGDGHTDLLLPVCTTDYCEESHIYVHSDGQVGSCANFHCISISQIVGKSCDHMEPSLESFTDLSTILL